MLISVKFSFLNTRKMLYMISDSIYFYLRHLLVNLYEISTIIFGIYLDVKSITFFFSLLTTK